MKHQNASAYLLSVIRLFSLSAITGILMLVFMNACLAATNFNVEQVTIPSTAAPNAQDPSDPSEYHRVDFSAPFDAGTTPNVFVLTTDEGGQSCGLRIRAVTNTGFEVTCLESLTLDRFHVSMTFDYIAIQDGGVTVPLNGGGSAEFISECVEVDAQQYHDDGCDGCSGPLSYDPVVFPTPNSLSGTPALLTQIQTTNNLNDQEALVLDVAVETGSLDSIGFNVAIEQSEAGIGELNTTETVCYLAANQAGCQDLDLSSLAEGGPSSVSFQAINTPETLDGWDNGCDAGEGATFAPGCFSNTPIVAADKITRRGVDGGWVRRCFINSDEVRLTIDEDVVSDDERGHTTEIASVFAFSSVFTTPVQLNLAKVSKSNRGVLVEWETAAESFHLGFNIWGEFKGEWVQLNNSLIKGNGLDSRAPKSYKRRVFLTREERKHITQFGLSSVDTSGYEEFYGPFSIGDEYGQSSLPEPIDWQATRAAFEASMVAQGFTKVGTRWKRVDNKRAEKLNKKALGLDRLTLNLATQETGLHRLSFAEVEAVTTAFTGVKLNRLALTLNGKPVPRHIKSSDGRFGPGDEILFVSRSMKGVDAPFLTSYTYQLKRDRSRVQNITSWGGDELTSDVSEIVWLETKLSSASQYSPFLPELDPWYDRQLFAVGSATSSSYEFELTDVDELLSHIKAKIKVHGGIDFGTQVPDHHLQISLNGTLLEDVTFDGLTTQEISLELPQENLVSGTNEITFALPVDTGFVADIVLIDEVVIRLPRVHEAQITSFVDAGEADFYKLSAGLGVLDRGFAYSSDGDLSSVKIVEAQGVQYLPSLPVNENLAVTYSLADTQDFLSVNDINLFEGTALHNTSANFIVISHQAFLTDELRTYIAKREKNGITAEIFSWADIVENYGFGNESPAALDRFLRQVDRQGQVDYVLIVGGHTSDFLGVTDESIINYVPAHYRAIGDFTQTPTDNPFVDFDQDGQPDAAIGRWPVRSIEDLKVIIDKSLLWQAQREAGGAQSALLIAQANDGRDLSFDDQFENRIVPQLETSRAFNEIKKIYFSELADGETTADAKERIASAINNGAELVSFNGHGSPVGWGFDGIVDTAFIASLTNTNTPTSIMPLACYTTYYQTTGVNTLAHQWLFAGPQGAAVVHGAAVLGEYRENSIFAERFLKEVDSSITFGKAIMQAKIASGKSNQMLNNWVLLGDPTLSVR
ncbi:MAG: C25 family cysteine peptidase [Pseudomonadota bacterium]